MLNNVVTQVSKSTRTFDILIISAFMWFLGKFIRYVFPPLFELLQDTYTVSTTALGWTFSVFLFAYALVQFPSGFLSDKFGPISVIIGGGLLSSIGTVIFILDVPFTIFVIMMFILGVGTGVHKTSAVQLLSTTYSSQRGRVLGIFDTFGTFGGVIAPGAVLFAAIIPGPTPGWRILLLITGSIALLSTVVFMSVTQFNLINKLTIKRNKGIEHIYKYFKSNPTKKSLNPNSIEGYIKIFRNKKFLIFVTASVFFSFTYYGIVSFLPLYLTQEAGISSGYASIFYSLLFIASVAQIGSGELSDRVGTLPVIAGSLGFATLSIILFMIGTDSGLFFIGICVLCIGLGAHSFRPVRGAYLMELLPDKNSAGGFGIVRTFLMGSGAVSPGLIGTISDIAGFIIAFSLLAFSVGIATILSIILIYINM